MKRKITLSTRRILEKVLSKNLSFINITIDEDGIITLEDVEPESDFYMTITETTNSQSNLIYKTKQCPTNAKSLTESVRNIPESQIEAAIQTWINLIVEYNKDSPVFDKSIEQFYFNELRPFFEILDEDSDRNPLNLSQQVELSKIYEDIIEDAIIIKDESERNLLVSSIESVKEQIPKRTKKEAINDLNKVFSKIRKSSVNLFTSSFQKFADKISGSLNLRNPDNKKLLE